VHHSECLNVKTTRRALDEKTIQLK
jgi:hypothetical protein